MGRPSAGLDLGVDGARDLVARQQLGRAAPGAVVVVPAVGLLLGVGGLGAEHVGDVVEHEALALGVAQHPAVAAHALGHQQSAHAERPDHARGVELDALHVDELGAGPQRHRVAVAGGLPGVGRELPGLADAAGGQDDRLGGEGDDLAGGPPVGDAPRGAAVGVVHDAQHLALHEDVGAHGHDLLLERADQLEPGAVAHVGQAREAVTAEVALEDLAVGRAVEERPPLLELVDAVRRLLGVQLGHAVVVEHLAAAHGVAEVHHPVVLGVDVAHRCGHAALGHDGVGLAQQGLGDDGDPEAALQGLDGRAQPGAARADDHDVVLVVFVGGHDVLLRRSGSR